MTYWQTLQLAQGCPDGAVWSSKETNLGEDECVHLGDLRELNDQPFVSFTLILQEGIPITVQDSASLFCLFVSCYYL